jgi:hypothetical protein
MTFPEYTKKTDKMLKDVTDRLEQALIGVVALRTLLVEKDIFSNDEIKRIEELAKTASDRLKSKGRHEKPRTGRRS